MRLFNLLNKKHIIYAYLMWAIGIALGTAILVAGSSVLASGKATISNAFFDAKVYHMEGPENVYWQEGLETTKDFPELKEHIPIYKTSGVAEVSRKVISVSIVGTTDRYLAFKQAKLHKGRFLTDYNIDNAQNIAVISSDMSLKLFGTKDSIGRELELKIMDRGTKLFVAGVTVDQADDGNYCYIPASLFEDISPNTGLSGMILSTSSRMHHREAEAYAVHLMDLSGISGWTAKLYQYPDFLVESYDNYFNAALIVAILFFLLGGIGASGALAALIRHSENRIKLSRFYGLSDQMLGSEIVYIAMYGGIAQGLLGTLIGFAASYFYCRTFGLVFAIDPFILLLALTAAIAVGILSGLFPAYKAIKNIDGVPLDQNN